MKIKQLVSVLLLCLLWVSPAMAFDFNELFGSDLLFEVAEEEERSLAETMLINEGKVAENITCLYLPLEL